MDTTSIEQTLQQLMTSPESVTPEQLQAFFAVAAPIIAGLSIFALIIYVYMSLTTMAMAKKLGNAKPWLAWIPIANIVLLWQLSATAQWTLILYFVAMFMTSIPILGIVVSIAGVAISIYWYWMICEKLGKPGWWSIFSIVFWPAWLVMMGILAWGENSSIKPVTPKAPVAS